ncbi:MAG: serine hydrolase [Armatimonadetes bacterium]|nr:serine hydrolase [Armatimonadota bacterium]
MRVFASCLLSLSLCLVASAQTPPDLEKKVDEICKGWDKPDAPGGVVGIAKDGKFLLAKGYGLANIELKVPNTVDTVMDVGSVSKQFTAMCVLLLEEDGKLSLDDDINKYLPEIPTFGKKVAIRNLLNHTSGLRDYLTIMAVQGWNVVDRRTFNDALAVMARQQGPNFAPGERYLYCNSGYMLAAVLVERVSGMDLGSFAEKSIFKPLGMDHTRFVTDDSAIVPNRALSYSRTPTGQFENAFSALAIYGDGGVHTTLGDMLKWHENFYANKLGKANPGLIAKMTEVGVFNDGKKSNYALGLVVDDIGGIKRIQHNGNWLGYNAATARFPDQHISVFAFGNDGTNNCMPYSEAIEKLMLGVKDVEQKEVKLEAEKLRPYAGTYALPDGRIMTITLDGSQLSAQVSGQQAFPIFPESPSKFFYKALKASIEFSGFEKPGEGTATLHQGAAVIAMPRSVPYKPSEDDMKRWVGAFRSDEMDMNISFKLSGDHLTAVLGRDEVPAQMVTANKCMAGGMTLEAMADAQSRVRGFTLNAGRAYGMRFVKQD